MRTVERTSSKIRYIWFNYYIPDTSVTSVLVFWYLITYLMFYLCHLHFWLIFPSMSVTAATSPKLRTSATASAEVRCVLLDGTVFEMISISVIFCNFSPPTLYSIFIFDVFGYALLFLWDWFHMEFHFFQRESPEKTTVVLWVNVCYCIPH